MRVLADNLHRAGRDVFFDQWDVVGGSRLSQRLQQGLESAEAVVLVVSRAAVGKPWRRWGWTADCGRWCGTWNGRALVTRWW